MQLRTSQPYPCLKMRSRIPTCKTSTRDTFQFTFQHTLKVAPLPFPIMPCLAQRAERNSKWRSIPIFSLPSSVFTLFRPEHDAIFLSMEEHYSPPWKPLPSSTFLQVSLFTKYCSSIVVPWV